MYRLRVRVYLKVFGSILVLSSQAKLDPELDKNLFEFPDYFF